MSKKLTFKTAFCPSKKSSLDTGSDSKVQQSLKDACDINKIIARYSQTGVNEHVNHAQPLYADVSELGDYTTLYNIVQRAEASFMALPAVIRKRFNNDPQQLINFVNDPDNYDEAVQLGLVNKPVSEAPNPSENKESEQNSES